MFRGPGRVRADEDMPWSARGCGIAAQGGVATLRAGAGPEPRGCDRPGTPPPAAAGYIAEALAAVAVDMP